MKRELYFDYLRGIAILMVVAIHTYPDCKFESFSAISQIAIRQIVGCPVPVFLAISAFFIGRKDLRKRSDRSAFWKKQIPKVYIPAVLWSLPLFALALIHGGSPLYHTIRLLVCGFSIYYFIALIVQYYLLLPVLQNVNNYKFGGVITGFISMICIILIAWFGINRLPLICYAGPFVTWIIFFYTGLMLSRSRREYPITLLIALLIVSIGMMLAETYLLQEKGKSGFGIKPSVYIYSFIMILILFSAKVQRLFNERLWINRIVCHIGRVSFGIYLIHCYFIMLYARCTVCSLWLMKWVFAVVSSVIFIFIVRKTIPNRFLKYIGLSE